MTNALVQRLFAGHGSKKTFLISDFRLDRPRNEQRVQPRITVDYNGKFLHGMDMRTFVFHKLPKLPNGCQTAFLATGQKLPKGLTTHPPKGGGGNHWLGNPTWQLGNLATGNRKTKTGNRATRTSRGTENENHRRHERLENCSPLLGSLPVEPAARRTNALVDGRELVGLARVFRAATGPRSAKLETRSQIRVSQCVRKARSGSLGRFRRLGMVG